MINAGYDIYEYEKYEILHKSRPLLMCGSHKEVRAMSWDERRYSATVEQGDAILNEASLIRVSLGEKVGIDNKTMTISYSYNDMGLTITDGTEKIYDMFMEVMGLSHSYPKEKDNECQISKSEQDLIAKLKEDKRRISDIKKKHGKEYETLSTNNQLTRNNRWMKNVHLSTNDVVELCELINKYFLDKKCCP